jgi:Cu/Ag efflux protein CusF
MRFFVLAGLFALAAASSLPGGLFLSVSTAQAAPQAQARGTVESVDARSGRVKIAHEPVQSLGWPAMTMYFELADRALLPQFEPGRQVVFTFVQRGRRFVITSIEP